ncbi:hypothetical protein EDB87DRAFT_245520 [Lactarius vividus]|nr:hypothetical protein EDB87DRAFT_245520 [Lactarius vividus]
MHILLSIFFHLLREFIVAAFKLGHQGNTDSVADQVYQGLGTTSIPPVLIRLNEQFKFTLSFLQSTYLNLVQRVSSAASVVALWYIEQHWRIDIKTMVSPTFKLSFYVTGSAHL